MCSEMFTFLNFLLALSSVSPCEIRCFLAEPSSFSLFSVGTATATGATSSGTRAVFVFSNMNLDFKGKILSETLQAICIYKVRESYSFLILAENGSFK